jgi:DNA-binding transcriptional regulator YhcF (GntR family)
MRLVRISSTNTDAASRATKEARMGSSKEGVEGVIGEDIPENVRVRAEIARAIREGRFHPGARLPSQRALAEEYGVARATILRAFEDLRKRGLISTVERDGTYVTDPGDRERSWLSTAWYAEEQLPSIREEELTICEKAALAIFTGRPINELLGIFFPIAGEVFTGAEWVDVYTHGSNGAVIDWGSGPTLEEVLAAMLPHQNDYTGDPCEGMPGLRVTHRGEFDVWLTWLPAKDSRLVLRRISG